MPVLFWIDTSFLFLSSVIAFSLAFTVIGTGLEKATSRFFALYCIGAGIWAIIYFYVHMALWKNPAAPVLWTMELWVRIYAATGPVLFVFSVRYLNCRKPIHDAIACLGLITIGILSLPYFHSSLFQNFRLDPNGTIMIDFSTSGLVASGLPGLFFSLSLIFFVSDRRRLAEPFIALSVLVLVIGLAIGGPLQLPFPVFSLTNASSLVLLGYAVLGKQLFNPLKVKNIELNKEIDRRERAEQQLKDSKMRLTQILNFLPDPTFGIDTDGKVMFWNQAIEALTGVPSSDIVGKDNFEYALPFYHERRPVLIDLVLNWDEEVAKKYEGVKRVNDTLVSETRNPPLVSRNAHFWNAACKLFDTQGQVIGAIESIRDISELRRSEEAIRESESRYRLLAQNASDVIYTVDLDMNLTYISPSVERLRGYTPEEMQEMSLQQQMTPESLELASAVLGEELALEQQTGADPNRSRTLELEYYCKDGSRVWSETKFTFLRDDKGRATGILGVGRDVTKRKQAEIEKEKLRSQLLQAQKMEAVGHLAGGIAHDFNNMLSVVLGNAELAMLEFAPDEKIRHRIKSIQDAAGRSTNLVRQLLAFARKQTIQPVILDINDTIASMLKVLHRLIGEDIDLAWIPGHNTGKVKIDPSQIDQILANLMVNARDAIGGVGKVTIETHNVEVDELYCVSHAWFTPGSFVMLAVSDNGCGMGQSIVEQVFEPFFTTKAAGMGTGLGLATVYGIVKQNRGYINVYSEPGKGTTFKIYLPMIEVPAERTESDAVEEVPPKGSETVLIVEDDETILVMAESILHQLGYEVISANTPDKAIAIAKACKGAIDLLITDVVMPLMNGRELAKRLKKIFPGIKCLYMSGYTADVIADHGVLEEGVSFVPKPFSIRFLARKVREVLDS